MRIPIITADGLESVVDVTAGIGGLPYPTIKRLVRVRSVCVDGALDPTTPVPTRTYRLHRFRPDGEPGWCYVEQSPTH